jgi:AcrR family transcriptional regulator
MCSVNTGGREALLTEAMRLFATRGVEATSLREVARQAGVSAPLVVHHFGGKEGLVAAVDGAALSAFGEAYSEADTAEGSELLRSRAEQTARVMQERPEVCAYLGRALIEGTPGARRLFRRLVEGGREEIGRLAEAGALREDADPVWATLQHFFLIWAPLSFQGLLEDEVLEGPLLKPDNLERWVGANVRLLRSGLYRDA